MALHQLTIGQAAEAAGLTRKAVRVYETRGLLPSAERSAAGYRLYDQEVIELLTFIRRARTLGLHLDDIREVLAIRGGGIPPCARVLDLLEDRVAEIDATVTELLALRKTLTDTRQRADDCADDCADNCADNEPAPSARSSRTRSPQRVTFKGVALAE